MDFKKAALISNYISKDYAEKIFKLLMAYQDISASEAASRLELHIRTVQEFLEVMTQFGILKKKEVYDDDLVQIVFVTAVTGFADCESCLPAPPAG